ncbi:fumarylacetoacetate hydrolase family protein [Devosia faecipullorum]|uniref:fumarylacetoacetate hydrolase family protein n=1 Tax=Devosia faecipullorum TaxID=2755039 RepID=UPI00187B5E56|nr:fumarylacetoacetate hydrolase family protein [Devosia faecipullorum]MBE7732906.1 fumarylacetoacetate hydrolase family protein [Devosia faecipullorum]
MKLCTIQLDGQPRVGLVEAAFVRVLLADAGDAVTLIGKGAEAIKALSADPTLVQVPLADARFMAPIQRFSRDILCTGWNYWDHFEESKGKREGQDVDAPKAPTFFTKGPNTVIGPYDDVAYDPHISAKWDYEAEVAIVIGKRCRSVSKAEALDYVFGYFLANDISQRDLQRRHGGQWLKGKSIDNTMPLGPYIVTGDELDIPEMTLSLTLNGQTMQSAKLKQMAFPIAELVAELSFGMTLEVGDVIITGTPAGIGNAREPAVRLKDGDEMVVAATGLGELRNRMVLTDLHGSSDIASMSAPE